MYDVIIIGAGPAGLTAAIYASRANLKTAIIEKGIYGGQMQDTADIENYPAFKKITGPELSQYMYDQATSLGVEYKYGNVEKIEDKGNTKIVKTSKEEFETYSVIIATGANPRQLGVDGEQEFRGKGVSYCAVCDGAFFRDKELVVVGGGDSAVEESNFLTNFASKVTLFHRRDKLRAQAILQNRIFDNPKVEVVYNTEVKEIKGDSAVKEVKIYNNETGEFDTYSTNGVFVYVGMIPNTESFKDLSILDEEGYIVAVNNMETSIPGVFVAGDVRQKNLRQIVTAAGDGSEAAFQAQHYVERIKESL